MSDHNCHFLLPIIEQDLISNFHEGSKKTSPSEQYVRGHGPLNFKRSKLHPLLAIILNEQYIDVHNNLNLLQSGIETATSSGQYIG